MGERGNNAFTSRIPQGFDSHAGGSRGREVEARGGDPPTCANNNTLNLSQLKLIANQLAGIRDEFRSLANTNYQGQYVFGGSQTATIPFSTSTSATSATPLQPTTYCGVQPVSYMQSPNGRTIQLNLPGSQIVPTSGTGSAFQALNDLIEDYASGARQRPQRSRILKH